MTPTTPARPAVRLRRTIPAPPEQVYRAWLEPDLLVRWMAPAAFDVTRAEVQEHVGGRYRIWQVGSSGEAGGFDCEILELCPNERIAFRWGFVGPDRSAGPRYDSLLSVSFDDAPGGATTLTLVHEQLDTLHAAMPDVADRVDVGWTMALDKLSAAVAARSR